MDAAEYPPPEATRIILTTTSLALLYPLPLQKHPVLYPCLYNYRKFMKLNYWTPSVNPYLKQLNLKILVLSFNRLEALLFYVVGLLLMALYRYISRSL
jgi:hypothetical protein